MQTPNLSTAALDIETRRPILVAWAQKLGIATEGETVVSLKHLLLLAVTKEEKTMATSKPTKPVVAAPKSSTPAKPAAAPAKPATPPPAPAKPPAPAPAKPGAAPAKPAAPPPPPAAKSAPAPAAAPAKPSAPAKPGAAPAKPEAPKHDESAEARVKELIAAGIEKAMSPVMTRLIALEETVKALDARVKSLDTLIASAAYGEGATMGEDGKVVLDIENAGRQQLLDWFHMFGYELPEGAGTEDMRAGLLALRAEPDFAGFDVVNDLGEGEHAPDPGETGGAAPAFTAEDVTKANWSRLVEMAGALGVDHTDIAKPPQPKVLRQRVLTALENLAAPADESAPEGDAGFTEGEAVWVSNGDETFEGVYVGPSETEGEVIVKMGEGEEEDNYSVPADQVSRPTALSSTVSRRPTPGTPSGVAGLFVFWRRT